jgi:hypothetical protein
VAIPTGFKEKKEQPAMRIRMLAIVGLVSMGSFSVVARQSALSRTGVTTAVGSRAA